MVVCHIRQFSFLDVHRWRTGESGIACPACFNRSPSILNYKSVYFSRFINCIIFLNIVRYIINYMYIEKSKQLIIQNEVSIYSSLHLSSLGKNTTRQRWFDGCMHCLATVALCIIYYLLYGIIKIKVDAIVHRHILFLIMSSRNYFYSLYELDL